MERKNAELILMADDRGNLHRFHSMIVIASPELIRKIIEDEFLRVAKDPAF
jgi:hypothetical protein